MKKLTKVFSLTAASALMLAVPLSAHAVTFADVGDSLFANFQSAANLISGAAYVMGAAFGVMAALKLKAHTENPGQEKLSKPLILLLIAGALLTLPSFLTIGGDSAGLQNDNSLGTGVLGGGLN